MIKTVIIEEIKSIEDTDGHRGPQKKITFISNNKYISGWVNDEEYDENAWIEGLSVELDISQNGKYTNFKLPSEGQSSESIPSKKQITKSPDIWSFVASLTKRIEALELLNGINHKEEKKKKESFLDMAKDVMGNPVIDDDSIPF